MFLSKICVISALFCLAVTHPADISKRVDFSEESADYEEKISDYFHFNPVEKERRVNLENCNQIICMPHHMCLEDMVVINGTELFEWRISTRTIIEAEKLVCGYMEVPCCSSILSNGDQSNSSEDYDEEDKFSNDDTNQNNEICGYRKQQNTELSTRIINGKEAEPNEFPWMVGIFERLSTGNLGYIGGGSLIHESVILTAAHKLLRYSPDHKLSRYSPEQLVIRAGEHDILDTAANNKRQERYVRKIIEHEYLDAKLLINDIALIVLDKPFKLTEEVHTICLPPQSFQTDNNVICTSSGWGKNASDRHGKYQARLQKGDLSIVKRGKCEKLLKKTGKLGKFYKLNDSLMCAGGGKLGDTCKGDGGSALWCQMPNDKNRFYQTGIVAGIVAGTQCGAKIPGMYVNVSHFTNWISLQLGFNKLHLQQQNVVPNDLFV